MATKQVWTVRVVNPTPYRPGHGIGSVTLPGLWVEQLRRLGYLREIKGYDGQHTPIPQTAEEKGLGRQRYEDNMSQVLEFYCPDPRGVDTKVWAEMQAQRMQSFGINAVAAPKWG